MTRADKEYDHCDHPDNSEKGARANVREDAANRSELHRGFWGHVAPIYDGPEAFSLEGQSFTQIR